MVDLVPPQDISPRRNVDFNLGSTSSVCDLRIAVGARVHTKTHFVTAASNSKRLFGTGRNTKGINGTVQEVVVDRSGKVAKTSLSVTWELAGEGKEGHSVCAARRPAMHHRYLGPRPG
jgi:hypothetical protein